MGPLTGIVVLDFSTLLPGPLATLLLAEAGAEVLKVERPEGGDEIRAYPPRWGRDSIHFALLNRGKKSLTIDLKAADAAARLEKLLARADIVVEQFRPGVMHRLGLSYEQLRERYPRLIYCSITGYGQTGPRRGAAGHDLNYISDTGLLALSHGDEGRPVLPPALIADIAGGAYPAVMNILLAVIERGRTGHGRHLDISMTDNMFPLMYGAIGQGLAGTFPGNGDALLTGGSPRYHLYPTQDGALMAVAALEQRFWIVFCDTIGLPAEQRDDRADPAGVIARVAALIAARPAAAWRPLLAAADCCCTIVATLADAMDDPHFVARALFAHGITNVDGDRIPALPVPIDPGLRAPPGDRPTPALGADNDQG
jgi:crotonobetainyl-CoA:carnitine CoA-transferase CaiB-like acyl-CoA transferase